jgi:hypothetical protein
LGRLVAQRLSLIPQEAQPGQPQVQLRSFVVANKPRYSSKFLALAPAFQHVI